MRREMRKLEGCVVCLDLSQCMSNLDKPGYRSVRGQSTQLQERTGVPHSFFWSGGPSRPVQAILDDVFFLHHHLYPHGF